MIHQKSYQMVSEQRSSDSWNSQYPYLYHPYECPFSLQSAYSLNPYENHTSSGHMYYSIAPAMETSYSPNFYENQTSSEHMYYSIAPVMEEFAEQNPNCSIEFAEPARDERLKLAQESNARIKRLMALLESIRNRDTKPLQVSNGEELNSNSQLQPMNPDYDVDQVFDECSQREKVELSIDEQLIVAANHDDPQESFETSHLQSADQQIVENVVEFGTTDHSVTHLNVIKSDENFVRSKHDSKAEELANFEELVSLLPSNVIVNDLLDIKEQRQEAPKKGFEDAHYLFDNMAPKISKFLPSDSQAEASYAPPKISSSFHLANYVSVACEGVDFSAHRDWFDTGQRFGEELSRVPHVKRDLISGSTEAKFSQLSHEVLTLGSLRSTSNTQGSYVTHQVARCDYPSMARDCYDNVLVNLFQRDYLGVMLSHKLQYSEKSDDCDLLKGEENLSIGLATKGNSLNTSELIFGKDFKGGLALVSLSINNGSFYHTHGRYGSQVSSSSAALKFFEVLSENYVAPFDATKPIGELLISHDSESRNLEVKVYYFGKEKPSGTSACGEGFQLSTSIGDMMEKFTTDVCKGMSDENVAKGVVQSFKSQKKEILVDISKKDLSLGNKNEEKERKRKQTFEQIHDWLKKLVGEKVASLI